MSCAIMIPDSGGGPIELENALSFAHHHAFEKYPEQYRDRPGCSDQSKANDNDRFIDAVLEAYRAGFIHALKHINCKHLSEGCREELKKIPGTKSPWG